MEWCDVFIETLKRKEKDKPEHLGLCYKLNVCKALKFVCGSLNFSQ